MVSGMTKRLLAAVATLAMCGAMFSAELSPGLEDRVRGTVLNERITAHWSSDTRFWYRRQTAPDRHEFMLVDAVAGTRERAFYHARMARELGTVLAEPVDAAALPIVNLTFRDDGRTVLLFAGGRWWEGALADPALKPSAATARPPLEREPRPTRGTGEGMSLEIVNTTKNDIELSWLGFDGSRKSYGWIPPGGERQQQTFEGHVWQVSGRDGAVLGVVESSLAARRIEVDGVLPPALPAKNPGLSPDGQSLVFINAHNLWLRTMNGGAVPLTSDGTAEDYYSLPVTWSPDSSHLAVFQTLTGERRTITLNESSPIDQLQSRSRSVRYDKPGDRIDQPRPRLVRIADRQRIVFSGELFKNIWSIRDLAWNVDGKAFTVLFDQRGHQIRRVVEVDLAGGTRALVEEHSPTFIDYAGKSFYRKIDTRREILWMSERDGWNHLWRYDAVSGQVKNQITKGAWAVRSVERVDEDAGLIWFTAGGIVPGQDPYHVHHACIAFDGSGLIVLTAGDGTHDVAWSPDHRWFIDTWSRVDAPPQHVLRDGKTGREVVALERPDISALQATGWQQPERFVAKGRDGTTDIHGVLWKPTGFDPAKSYPVVECIYAGPQSAYVPKAFKPFFRQQAIADLGFVVGMVDCLGTSYRSKAFHDGCWKNLADAGFPDRIPWWKAASQARPWLDLSRVGIYGGSAGGQNALGALLFHPEFYQVAVADCGCHDNRMDKIWWNELWMGWPVGPHYAEQSNVINAHKLQGKLMLIVGELDDNVDPASTFRVARALEQAGRDFELVVVHGAGHGAAETPFGSKKRAGFLVRHLLGREP